MRALRAPERAIKDIYSGAFRKEFIEHTYWGRINVINGIALVDNDKDFMWLYNRGYEEIPIERVCTICRQVFDTVEDKIKHDKEVHSKEEVIVSESVVSPNKYTCDICGKSFKSKRALHMHKVRMHGGISK